MAVPILYTHLTRTWYSSVSTYDLRRVPVKVSEGSAAESAGMCWKSFDGMEARGGLARDGRFGCLVSAVWLGGCTGGDVIEGRVGRGFLGLGFGGACFLGSSGSWRGEGGRQSFKDLGIFGFSDP